MKTSCSAIASKCLVFLSILLWSCNLGNDDEESPFRFLTPDAAVVVYAQQPGVFVKKLDKLPLYASIRSSQMAKNLSRDVEMLRLITGDSTFRYTKDKPITGGLVLTGAKQYGWIFMMHYPSGAFTFQKDTSIFIVDTYTYEGKTIYYITSKATQDLYLSVVGKIALVSRHKELVEEALRTRTGTHSLEDEPGFKDVFKTINKKDPINILINLKEFEALTKVLLPKTPLTWIKNIGRWVALDVDFSDPVIRFDGLVQVPDSQGLYLSVLAQNTVAEKKLGHLPIPESADGFVHFNLGNYATFYRKYNEYLEQNGLLIKHNRAWESDYPSFPKKAIQELLKAEFGFYVSGSNTDGSRVYYFRMTDVAKAMDLMQLPESGTQPLRYRGYLIHEIKKTGILKLLFGNFVALNSGALYTAIGDFLIVAQNESALYNCINAWEEGNLLTKEKGFEEILAGSSQAGHLIAYSKNSFFEKWTAHHLGKNFPNLRQLLKESGMHHNALLQINFLNQSAYISVVYGRETSEKQLIRQLWTLRNTDISYGPKAVVNHIIQSEEIIYQDSKSILHKLSPEGTTLWKRQLDAPIVYSTQWDMYKNGRLQHVIVTQRTIYVLDRNGNDVKPWPMKLQGIVTTAALMDYDNTKNYRLLVGEGNTLHNLDTEAKPVKGWQLTRLSAPLAYEPKWYQSQGRDFLLFQLQDGTIWVTDRTGATRVQGKFPYMTHHQVQLNFPTDGRPWYVTYLKSNGEQIHAFQNGKTDSIRVLQAADFGYVAQDGDFMSYAFGNKVVVKDRNVFFESKVQFTPTEAPARYVWNNTLLYAIVSSADEKISLLRSDGSTVEGFPLYGSARPLFLKTAEKNQFILVTQSNQGHLIAYAINEAL